MFNTEARIEMDDKAYYVPVGNGTDVALLRFMQEAEVPVHDIVKRRFQRVMAHFPFSTNRKRSVLAMAHPDL